MKNFEREEVENIANQKLKRYGSPSNLLYGVVLAWTFIIFYVLLEATPIKILIYRSFHYSIVYIIHIICYIFFGVLLIMSMTSFYYYFKTPSYLNSNIDHTKIVGSPDKKKIPSVTSRKVNFDIRRRNKSMDNVSHPKPDKPQYTFYSPSINPIYKQPVDPITPMSTSSKYKQLSPTMRSSSLYTTPLTDPTITTHTRKSDIMPSTFKRTSSQTKGVYTQQSQLNEFTKQYMSSSPSHVPNTSLLNNLPEDPPKYQASPAPHIVMNRTDDSDVKSDIYYEPDVSKNIDNWVENIMKWICKNILKTLYTKIKKYENQLQLIKDISDLKTTSQQTQPSIGGFQTTSTSLLSMKPSIQQPNIQQQDADRSEKEEIYEYLKSFGSEFLYVYERIKTLQSDNVMKEFNWNGGGSYKGKPWTKELPCDAQIIMNLFCEHLNLISIFKDSSRLKILLSNNDIPNKTGIKMKETNPPYYILYDSGKDIPLKRGRQNVFHAICLFLYLVDKGGRFFQRLDFGKINGLLDVVKR